MRRVGVTLEDVMEAADTLQAQGENPTIDRIRAFLGHTGSNTTIAKYMHSWRNNIVHGRQPEAPLSPPDPVQMAVTRVWQQIREETDAEIEAIKTETQRLVSEAAQQVTAAVEESKRITILCEGLQEQVHYFQAQVEIQKLDYQKLENERGLLEERYQGIIQRYHDLQQTTAKHAENSALAHQTEINHLTEKLMHQETLYQKIIDEIKHHAEEQRQESMCEIDALKTSNKKISKDLEISQSTLSSKELAISELKTEQSVLKAERDSLMTRISDTDKHWDIFKENSSLTNNIWSEIQDIPKMDFANNSINLINDIQVNIEGFMEKLSQISRETTATFELISKIDITKVKSE